MTDVAIPASIPQLATTAEPSTPDQTRALNEVLAKLKPGQRLVAPEGGKYRAEGTVILQSKRDVEIAWRGTRLVRFQHRDLPVLADPWLGRGDATGAEHLIIADGEHVRMNGGAVVGPNRPAPGRTWPAYIEELEFQHGLLVWGGSDLELDDMRYRFTHGDGVRISGAVDGVTLTRHRIEQVGRQGITLDSATNVKLLGSGGPGSDFLIWGVARTCVNIEPGGNHWLEQYGTVRHVEIAGLRIGYSMGHTIAAGGAGPNVGNIYAHHLFCDGMYLRIGCAAVPVPFWGKRPGHVFERGPFTVEDSRSNITYGSPVAFSYNRRLSRLSWHRNYQAVATTQSRLAVYAESCGVVDVRENAFPGAREEVTVR